MNKESILIRILNIVAAFLITLVMCLRMTQPIAINDIVSTCFYICLDFMLALLCGLKALTGEE